MNSKQEKAAAAAAFRSPTALAARMRSKSPTRSDASSVVPSTSGRTNYSKISVQTVEEKQIFHQMIDTTSVDPNRPLKNSSRILEIPGMSEDQVKEAMRVADHALATAGEYAETAKKAVVGNPGTKGLIQIKEGLEKHYQVPRNAASGQPPKPTIMTYGALESKVPDSNSSVASQTRRTLDLKQNDNAFHVIANLVVDFFEKKVPDGETAYTLTEEDRKHLDQMVPASVRYSFVEAVRYRLEHSCPPDSDYYIHVLTRKCQHYGLNREGDENPLLATLNPVDNTVTIDNLPPPIRATGSTVSETAVSDVSRNAQAGHAGASLAMGVPIAGSTVGSSIAGTSSGKPPLAPGTDAEQNALRAKIEEQKRRLIEKSEETSIAGTASVLTTPSNVGSTISDPHVNSTESLARQQLMAELREASNLMAESQTPEAAQFWRNHVVDLQSRIRALHAAPPARETYTPPKTERTTPNQELLVNAGAPNTVRTPHQNATPTPWMPQDTNDLNVDAMNGSSPSPRTTTENRHATANQDDDYERALPMVDVVAPADLPGGYHFEAEIEGRRFLATVPNGGVQKGETFSCLMRDLETVGVDIPVGRWRDRLCDCGIYGCLHPLFCTTLFCPLLVLGQIMSRLKFDHFGRPQGSHNKGHATWSSPFLTMMSVIIFWGMMNCIIYGAYYYKWSSNMPLSVPDYVAIAMLNIVLGIYAIYATMATRGSLRDKFMIREHRFYDLEDCCCATFCMPCTICQMGRHTASYEHVDAVCCSETGLPPEAQDSKRVNDPYIN